MATCLVGSRRRKQLSGWVPVLPSVLHRDHPSKVNSSSGPDVSGLSSQTVEQSFIHWKPPTYVGEIVLEFGRGGWRLSRG